MAFIWQKIVGGLEAMIKPKENCLFVIVEDTEQGKMTRRQEHQKTKPKTQNN